MPKSPRYRGVFPVVPTTFTESGDVFDGWLLVLPRPVERPDRVAFATPA